MPSWAFQGNFRDISRGWVKHLIVLAMGRESLLSGGMDGVPLPPSQRIPTPTSASSLIPRCAHTGPSHAKWFGQGHVGRDMFGGVSWSGQDPRPQMHTGNKELPSQRLSPQRLGLQPQGTYRAPTRRVLADPRRACTLPRSPKGPSWKRPPYSESSVLPNSYLERCRRDSPGSGVFTSQCLVLSRDIVY